MTFAIGFRQYLHFHLHSVKQQLHTRMRRRVGAFERVIQKARREKEGEKNWKEAYVGESHGDRELKAEEKKAEEVLRVT